MVKSFIYTICFLEASIVCAQHSPTTAFEHKKLDSIVYLNERSKTFLYDSTTLSIQSASQAIRLARSIRNLKWEAISMVSLAEGYLINDLYDKALEYNLQALEILQKIEAREDVSIPLTSLGWLYYDIGDAENSLKYHRMAYDVIKMGTDTFKISTAINAIGLDYSLKKEYNNALPYFKKALELGMAIDNDLRISASLNNLADAQIELGDYDAADSALQIALRHLSKIKDVLRTAETISNLGNLYTHLGKYREALSYLDQSSQLLDHSKSNAKKEIQLNNAFLYAQLFEKTGDYRKAFENLKLHHEMYEQILSDVKKKRIAQKKAEIEIQQKEKLIESLEKDRELRITQRNATAIAIILFSIVGFAFYSRERKLRIKEAELSKIHEALILSDLEKIEVEKQLLNNKLEYKNTEITNFALHISQRNEWMNQFVSDLQQIRKKPKTEANTEIDKLIRRFSNNEQISKDTEHFHINIETEYKDFLYNLQKRFPDLTENEKRLCAQVRLNLSIKDIASINNISVKSVEMARYRLRKKFGLNHEDNLTEFLKNF